jgi:hypothetical protein
VQAQHAGVAQDGQVAHGVLSVERVLRGGRAGGGDTTDVGLVVVALLVALAVGRLAGGSVTALTTLVLRRRRLVVAALGAQLAGVVVGGPVHAAGLLVSTALVAAFLAANRGVRGTGLVALGLAANALVVALNGAMPVSTDAAARAGTATHDLLSGADPRHELVVDGTRLPWLADVVPVPMPLRPEVVSPGDVLVTAGVAQLVAAGMLAGRAQGRQRPAPVRRRLPPLPSATAPAPPRAPRGSLPAPPRARGPVPAPGGRS